MKQEHHVKTSLRRYGSSTPEIPNPQKRNRLMSICSRESVPILILSGFLIQLFSSFLVCGCGSPEQEQIFVWYIPGFLSADKDQDSRLNILQEIYPEAAEIQAIPWNQAPQSYSTLEFSNNWSDCIAATDAVADRLFQEILRMSQSKREKLIMVGHSLGGNITVKVLARCHDAGIHIQQMVLLGAAISNTAPEVEMAMKATLRTNYSFVNRRDAALAAFNAAERGPALGQGYAFIVDPNQFREVVSPQKMSHNAGDYLQTMYRCFSTGNFISQEPVVPQCLVNATTGTMGGHFWWNTLDSCRGWELQQHKVTSYCRILDRGNDRVAWGRRNNVQRSFNKVKFQIENGLCEY
ncbi:MAG: alpha/beta hydrolase [Planctomycetia bacterium]|nr:alpha/beta hydrolase [Planctomycetia bacterium]